MAGAVAAVIASARRRIVRAFLEEDATAPERAISYAPSMRQVEARAFRRFLDVGVIRETEPGKYYLDTLRMEEYRGSIRKRVVIAIVLMAVVAWLATVFGK